MPAYAQIITHSPEQVAEWKEIVISNPGRIARTLVLELGETIREGDNQGDIYPALEAMNDILMHRKDGAESQAWPQDLLEEVMNEIWNEPKNPLSSIYGVNPNPKAVDYSTIIAWHWKFAQRPLDATITSSMLYLLLEPKHPCQLTYMCSHGMESVTLHILSKILIGARPMVPSSKQQQAKALITIFPEHLVLLSGHSLEHELDLLSAIISAAKKDLTKPEIIQVVLKSTPLWNTMFRVLKKSAKPTPVVNQSPNQDWDTEKDDRLHVISNAVRVMGKVLHNAHLKHRTECVPLVHMWANENFFGAIKEMIELFITIPGMTRLINFCLQTVTSGITLPGRYLGDEKDHMFACGLMGILNITGTKFARFRRMLQFYSFFNTMAFNNFLDLTKVHPDVLSAELLAKVSMFLLYTPRFKNDILLTQESNWPSELVPWILPKSVMTLLSNLCGMSHENIEDLWSYLKDTVWNHDEKAKEVETRLKLYGKALSYGVCLAWAIRLQCEGCGNAYYHNYQVKDGMRYYYDEEIPNIIQVGEHQHQHFMGTLPNNWLIQDALKGDHIQDGFTILSLLEDCHEKAGNFNGSPYWSIWVTVMDGIGLQHPTCAHHNCKNPLTTARDRYCAKHQDLNNGNAPVVTEKLKCQCVLHPNDALPDKDLDAADLIDDEEEEEFEINEEDLIHGVHEGMSDPCGASPVCTSASRNKKRISAQFGRKRTHNEQILVAPCGVILAWETFYGAEAISTCASNCNPAAFKELHGKNGKAWFFNSSIAEQTNVWLGGFHVIMTVEKLEKDGCCPIIKKLG
ncbi:hypothetical protein CPB84DRAFT_1743508 [Gymnopilus junonius]|uniref:Uncharacterized protein n=1 Tax=Gymnopilus junonius TaxID=109634 RepID=A0A9P5NUS2_GYMJU|nr:hypothetical protein CPB84DRAFT_1743508 [Gymnopilus junonius]